MNYNLLEEKWIPVLGCDGKMRRVGIKEALTQANRIRQIAASNPMDRVAILRFLLALLYWCKGNPPYNIKTTSTKSFPTEWFSKLDENKECFNLLGDGKRFYQYCKSGSASDKKLSANYLIHETPTGTNMWHFRHSTDKVDGLCRACCAMGLLRLPSFATSAGRGKSPGINAKPPFYVIPVGESLETTLSLSWQEVLSPLGTPAWEKPDINLPSKGEVPLLMGLTWLPRRVWLGDPSIEGCCVSCGRKEHLIRDCVFAGIGSTKTTSRVWRDPHIIHTTNNKGNVTSLHAGNALGASDTTAGQWARVVTGLLQRQDISSSGAKISNVHAWVVGFSTVKNDKYLEAIEWAVPFPCSPHQIEETIEKAKRWQNKGFGLIRKFRPPNEKKSSRKHVEIPPMLAAISPHVEARVSARVGELLAGGDDAWEEAGREYRPMMKIIAKSLSPGFTTSAVERRREITEALPDMRKKPKPAKNPKSRKGGSK